jgi:hypothetical protein
MRPVLLPLPGESGPGAHNFSFELNVFLVTHFFGGSGNTYLVSSMKNSTPGSGEDDGPKAIPECLKTGHGPARASPSARPVLLELR